ncbi:MAG: M20/M25/M40 family metallo-hydrolase [Kiritimatiellaeota bacterium]|nr:M20/M25/M40 family metallo-hydrolase [Kiritimatiellota bacterium]
MRDKIKNWLDVHRDEITAEWFELLRFPSIGTDPAHLQDCKDCALWLTAWLEGIGFTVSWQGPYDAPPNILAERKTSGEKPTLLIYGHYDVQPVDPVEAWRSPPFAPECGTGLRPVPANNVDGSETRPTLCVYARGAQDNKGQLWWVLQAIRAALECDANMPNIKIVIDGQEESGSGELVKLIAKLGSPEVRKSGSFELLSSDILLVADTHACSDGRPALTAGLRGVSSLSFRLHGPDHDLHSGSHGGIAPNPAVELAKIVAAMFAPDGSIAVEGFMDDVIPPTDEEMALALSMPFNERDYEAGTGVPPVGGRVDTPPQVRGALMPTIEVNGFHSGYGGEGGKTIIPAFAEVKISCRTVPGQTPAKVIDSIRGHFKRHTKNGLRLEEVYAEEGAVALRVGVDSKYAKIAREILDSMDSRGSAVVYEGASIHIVGALAEAAGAEPLLVGFGHDSDRIHAPNESYSFAQAEQNFRFTAELIERIKS